MLTSNNAFGSYNFGGSTTSFFNDSYTAGSSEADAQRQAELEAQAMYEEEMRLAEEAQAEALAIREENARIASLRGGLDLVA